MEESKAKLWKKIYCDIPLDAKMTGEIQSKKKKINNDKGKG